jgi:hypothetical protein
MTRRPSGGERQLEKAAAGHGPRTALALPLLGEFVDGDSRRVSGALGG